MKKVFFLGVVIAISMFYACEIEEELIESNNVTPESVTKLTGANWICTYIPVRGFYINGGTCVPNNRGSQVCSYTIECENQSVFEYGDFCVLMPCKPDLSNPWAYTYETVPADFGSLRDKYKLDIDPREAAIPFALNEKIAGLQFYKEAGLFKDKVYRVNNTLILDEGISKKLGLQGNVVKPGKYPVIVNEKNGTYNAILAVEKGYK